MKKIIIFILIILISFFFVKTCYSILSYKSIQNNKAVLKKITAVVVLTGGKGRIAESMKFLPLKNVKILIISGANPVSSRKDILRYFNKYSDFFYKIIIENSSKNTVENAIEVKKILKKRGVIRFLVITSSTHIYRSKIIFEKIFNEKEYRFFFWKTSENIKVIKVLKEILKLMFDYVYIFFLTNFN